MFIKLESVWELLRNLPDAINELQKNWGTICVAMMIITMAHSLV